MQTGNRKLKNRLVLMFLDKKCGCGGLQAKIVKCGLFEALKNREEIYFMIRTSSKYKSKRVFSWVSDKVVVKDTKKYGIGTCAG